MDCCQLSATGAILDIALARLYLVRLPVPDVLFWLGWLILEAGSPRPGSAVRSSLLARSWPALALLKRLHFSRTMCIISSFQVHGCTPALHHNICLRSSRLAFLAHRTSFHSLCSALLSANHLSHPHSRTAARPPLPAGRRACYFSVLVF